MDGRLSVAWLGKSRHVGKKVSLREPRGATPILSSEKCKDFLALLVLGE